eukprot:222236_1
MALLASLHCINPIIDNDAWTNTLHSVINYIQTLEECSDDRILIASKYNITDIYRALQDHLLHNESLLFSIDIIMNFIVPSKQYLQRLHQQITAKNVIFENQCIPSIYEKLLSTAAIIIINKKTLKYTFILRCVDSNGKQWRVEWYGPDTDMNNINAIFDKFAFHMPENFNSIHNYWTDKEYDNYIGSRLSLTAQLNPCMKFPKRPNEIWNTTIVHSPEISSLFDAQIGRVNFKATFVWRAGCEIKWPFQDVITENNIQQMVYNHMLHCTWKEEYSDIQKYVEGIKNGRNETLNHWMVCEIHPYSTNDVQGYGDVCNYYRPIKKVCGAMCKSQKHKQLIFYLCPPDEVILPDYIMVDVFSRRMPKGLLWCLILFKNL